MDYFKRFNFLFAAPVFDADDLEGVRFNQIIEEIQRSGFEVVRARKLEDAEMAVQTDAAIGCMVVDWGKKGLEGKTSALINLMRRRGLDFRYPPDPAQAVRDLPVEVLDFIDGYVFLSEETRPSSPRTDQPAQAICRDAEDAVLRRAGRLCRGGRDQLWTVRVTMAADVAL